MAAISFDFLRDNCNFDTTELAQALDDLCASIDSSLTGVVDGGTDCRPPAYPSTPTPPDVSEYWTWRWQTVHAIGISALRVIPYTGSYRGF